MTFLSFLFTANQENDEIVLNIIYCFYVFVKVGVELREQIFQQTSTELVCSL